MTGLTAIDILLTPDEATVERAQALNAVLRGDLASGFALDETHQPHVTVLQRYVGEDDLDGVFLAVDDVIASTDVATLRLHAVNLAGAKFGTPPDTLLVSIDIAPAPALLALHEALVEAIAPFARSGGAAAAFVSTADEPAINAATIAYVESFVPAHSGRRYAPHLTVGVAGKDLVERLEASPFADFELSPRTAAVYQLGNFGAARRVLMSRPLPLDATAPGRSG